LSRGEKFATVGLSHLTTSGQHVAPAVFAETAGEEFVITGTIPWVTGAAHADHIVMGATLPDHNQILAIMPMHLPGVVVGQPLQLAALQGSMTAQVRCQQVRLGRQWLLAGPTERVLAGGRGGPGGIETTCLALGLGSAAIDLLTQETQARPEIGPVRDRLQTNWDHLWEGTQRGARGEASPEAMAHLRSRANSLVLRATQAALTACKGAGFVRPHPAQRFARQALFFLVWSCPRPAADATLALLASPGDSDCL
jgi:alkylation response protein AidB-like acyl-CoA dehydrogenase